MAEQIKIDSDYTYEYDDGHVRILRHGQPWLENPAGAKAWIAAAYLIEELREQIAQHSRVKTTDDDEQAVKVAIGYEPVLVSMPPGADGKHHGGLTYRTASDRDYIVKVIAPLLAQAREEGRQAGLAAALEASEESDSGKIPGHFDGPQTRWGMAAVSAFGLAVILGICVLGTSMDYRVFGSTGSLVAAWVCATVSFTSLLVGAFLARKWARVRADVSASDGDVTEGQGMNDG